MSGRERLYWFLFGSLAAFMWTDLFDRDWLGAAEAAVGCLIFLYLVGGFRWLTRRREEWR